MSTNPLHTYRHLLREINRQFTRVNGDRIWAAQLRQQWQSASTDTSGHHHSQNALTYLFNNRKYKDLLAEFNPKSTEGNLIERTARRVGLQAPKSYAEKQSLKN
ncbi:hypothetical protein LPJ66_005738 [Kickxella alabastrina]|uniref:Uncharacterized protein n=1 Tax=Kickxella alabastrina TaxID=61397 RepID=A0ACC1IFZ8_9FUNG|nr:hypothetical protein LPJ66_005738 [Kickxella alabastrina]